MSFQKKTLTPQAHRPDEDRIISKKMVLEEAYHPPLKNFTDIEKQAEALYEKNLFSQAENIIKNLHIKGFSSSKTYCILGCCYHQKNQFKQALDAYKQALSQNPSCLEALVNLSLLRMDLGDYNKGLYSYKQAERIYFQNKETRWQTQLAKRHIQSGVMYFDKGLYHEALLEFLKARPSVKKSLQLQLNIIRCCWHLNRKREALEQLQALKKENPLSLSVPLLLGEYYFYLKKITLAIEEWERVLRLDPKNKTALAWLSKSQFVEDVQEDSLA